MNLEPNHLYSCPSAAFTTDCFHLYHTLETCHCLAQYDAFTLQFNITLILSAFPWQTFW